MINGASCSYAVIAIRDRIDRGRAAARGLLPPQHPCACVLSHHITRALGATMTRWIGAALALAVSCAFTLALAPPGPSPHATASQLPTRTMSRVRARGLRAAGNLSHDYTYQHGQYTHGAGGPGTVCVVTSDGDHSQADGGGGGNSTTFRDCINLVNANANGAVGMHLPPRIEFAPGVVAIHVVQPLPEITAARAIINGCGVLRPLVYLSGAGLLRAVGGQYAEGLVFATSAANATVRGLVIDGFPSHGLIIRSMGVRVAGPLRSSNNGGDGVVVMAEAANCTLGLSGTAAEAIAVTGNKGVGIRVLGPRFRMANARVGVHGCLLAQDGSCVDTNGATRIPAPNEGPAGILVHTNASDCVIGAPGKDGVTVVSGNALLGILLLASGTRVLNTLVGVGADGTTPIPNKGYAGIWMDTGATDCIIGAAGNGSITVVSGNSGIGIKTFGSGLRVLNTRVGVAVNGATPVPNTGSSGIEIHVEAVNCVIGAPGRNSITVVSGNAQIGINVFSVGTRVLNTRVGVALDGATPAPNTGQAGILVNDVPVVGPDGLRKSGTPTNCVIGAPGNDSINVVSGNVRGFGIGVNGANVRVLNTLVGVAVDGTTPVPNEYGIYVSLGGANCTIGAPGVDRTTVVSGNDVFGITVASK